MVHSIVWREEKEEKKKEEEEKVEVARVTERSGLQRARVNRARGSLQVLTRMRCNTREKCKRIHIDKRERSGHMLGISDFGVFLFGFFFLGGEEGSSSVERKGKAMFGTSRQVPYPLWGQVGRQPCDLPANLQHSEHLPHLLPHSLP